MTVRLLLFVKNLISHEVYSYFLSNFCVRRFLTSCDDGHTTPSSIAGSGSVAGIRLIRTTNKTLPLTKTGGRAADMLCYWYDSTSKPPAPGSVDSTRVRADSITAKARIHTAARVKRHRVAPSMPRGLPFGGATRYPNTNNASIIHQKSLSVNREGIFCMSFGHLCEIWKILPGGRR